MFRIAVGVMFLAASGSAQTVPCPPGQVDNGSGCVGNPPPQGPSQPPAFSKAFAPSTVEVGEASTLTFTIDQTTQAAAATALSVADDLPAGLIVSTPAEASTTCTGGTLTAVAGSGMISYSGGAVAAGTACTVTVDVMPTASGTLVSVSGDLTSSLGNSGPASATLTALAPPIPTIEFDAIQQTAREGDGRVELRLALSKSPERDVEVVVALTRGSPADLGGFESTAVEIEAAAGGPRTLLVEVPVTDDGSKEETEVFLFDLQVADRDLDVLSTTSRSTVAVVIVDDDEGAIVVTVPPHDADGDGVEDGGLRFLSLPVGALTVGELAAAAGTDVVYWFREGFAPVEASPGAALRAGEPVLLDVAPGADVTVSGTPPSGPVSVEGIDGGGRFLLPIGNPSPDALPLSAVSVSGGELAGVALVFDDEAGSFRPVSLATADAVLAPYAGVVLQVTPDTGPVTATVPVDASGAGPFVGDASFTPGDEETAVMLVLRPAASGATRSAAPGDRVALRFLSEGAGTLDPYDGVDVGSPFGATLAVEAPDVDVPLAVFAHRALDVGVSVTVPLSVAVPEAGEYELVYERGTSPIPGPLVVEVLDRGMAAALDEGDVVPFTASAADALAPGAFADRFEVRITAVGNVSAEDPLDRLALSIYPNPSRGDATVSITGMPPGRVHVSLYDVLGRRAAVFHDGLSSLPDLTLSLADADLAPGVYVLRVEAEGISRSRRLTVIR